jgi:6-phosphofructokinase 1
MKTVGILTGGGDCPGLNAVIRAIVVKSIQNDIGIVGIRNGWAGLVNGEVEPLTPFTVSGILPRGGTIIGTSRTNPFKSVEDTQKVLNNIKKFGLDAIIVIGGEDTLGVAAKLYDKGIPVVGVPKTIDNDLSGTDFTFGFDTAVSIATEAIDRLHSTAESHNRVMVVEVMGRHAGWIATFAGLAGGADCILIPETPFKIKNVCDLIKKRHNRGKKFSILVVAEGAKPAEADKLVTRDKGVDAFGHVRLGGIGDVLAQEIENRIKLETRGTTLGHIQRGGSPTAHDRILATRFGIKAVELVLQGKFGKMAALQCNKISEVDLKEAVKETKTVDPEIFSIAETFFG